MSKDLKAAAISYELGMEVPVLLAFGKNRLAEIILDLAKKHEIPVQEEGQGVMKILEGLELGSEIPMELWDIMAKIFAYLHSNSLLENK